MTLYVHNLHNRAHKVCNFGSAEKKNILLRLELSLAVIQGSIIYTLIEGSKSFALSLNHAIKYISLTHERTHRIRCNIFPSENMSLIAINVCCFYLVHLFTIEMSRAQQHRKQSCCCEIIKGHTLYYSVCVFYICKYIFFLQKRTVLKRLNKSYVTHSPIMKHC